MTELKMICMGDIHLDHLIWRKHRNICDDSLIAFASLIDHVLEKKVPLVLVGDIFDTIDPDSSLVEFFRFQMERCEAADIEVFCIQGNHDKRQTPWYVAASSWPQHIGSGFPLKINGIRCFGLDYAGRDIIEGQLLALQSSRREAPPRPDVSDIQILFLHQAVRQALRFDGAWNCDLDWVPDGIPLTIMGDIHKHVGFPTLGGGWAFYTGSTHPRSLDELGPKNCLGIMDDLSIIQLPLETRFIRKIVLGEGMDPGCFGAQFYKDINDASVTSRSLEPVVWLRYGPAFSTAAETLIGQIATQCPTCIVVRDPMVTETTEEEASEQTTDLPPVTELLTRCIDPSKEPFAYQFCLGLLEPMADLQERIRDQRDRFIASSTTSS